jgi:hypothetical protein
MDALEEEHTCGYLGIEETDETKGREYANRSTQAFAKKQP